jgi:hypothetical protein
MYASKLQTDDNTYGNKWTRFKMRTQEPFFHLSILHITKKLTTMHMGDKMVSLNIQ